MRTVVLLVLAGLSFTSMAEIYKWTDAQGNVHYGDKPVRQAEQMHIPEEKSGNFGLTSEQRKARREKLLQVMQEDRQEKEKQKAEKQKKRDKLNRQCILAKDQLKRYQKGGRIYNLDDKGKRIYMSDKERDEAVQHLQDAIRKHCE